MRNYAYSPASLTVRAGDTVTWMQHDSAPHDVVTTSAPAAFRSPLLSQGQSWSYTFRQAGTYSYYCSVHPDMRAQITVLPADTPAPAPAAPKPSAAPAPTRPAARPPVSSNHAVAPPGPAPSAGPGPSLPSSVPAEPASPAPPPTEGAAVAQQAATGPSLDPMLLVAGVVTGVAVFCLLLLGSRRRE